jgi:hypothetical protein
MPGAKSDDHVICLVQLPRQDGNVLGKVLSIIPSKATFQVENITATLDTVKLSTPAAPAPPVIAHVLP